MFLTRKIGAVLRGKATPFQILLAALLGALLGFVPGFFLPGDLGGGLMQAPGLIVLLLVSVLVLNANLGVFGLVTLLAKLLSFPLLPVSYRIGVFLLDGPLQGLFRSLVNGRVSAWFGLEYYATAGGLVVGAAVGLVSGLLLNRIVRTIRQRMASVEEGSERYQTYAKKWWVRFSTWLLLGKGKGRKTWRDLAEQKRFGMPIRVTGVLLAAVGLTSLWVFQQWFSTPILTRNVQGSLEAINGATVDLAAARLDFAAGTLHFSDLAIADSRNLQKDLLAADTLVATIDTGELLRKRFVIDELRSTSARAGTRRVVPGVRLPGPQQPPEPPPATGTKTIDDYLKDFDVWKQRLEQAREWIDVLSGGDEPAPAESTPEQRAEDRAEQEELVGMAKVVAEHLLEAGPRVLIRRIDIEGIDYTVSGRKEKVDLRLRNVADLPSLVPDAMSAEVATQSESLRIALNSASQHDPALGFRFALRGLAVDDVFGQLRVGGAPPLRGGTLDLEIAAGKLRDAAGEPMTLDLPLQVTLKDTVFALAGAKETKVDSLLLPIGLRGPVTQPTVSLDDQALQQALVAAGQKELANFVQGQAGKLLGELPAAVQGVVDPTKPPEQILDEAKRKAEEEARRLEEEAKKKAAEEAKKLLPGGLKGLLPGSKQEPKKE